MRGIIPRRSWRKLKRYADKVAHAALEAGVTMIAPETVFLSADTKFGKDVVVEPYVVFKPGVVGRGAHHSLVLASRRRARGKTAIVGRMHATAGTRLGKVYTSENFVEVKEARIDAGAKANHLSYIVIQR